MLTSLLNDEKGDEMENIKEKNSEFVGTFIRPSTNEKLNEIADSKKWSRAQLVRLILEEHVANNAT